MSDSKPLIHPLLNIYSLPAFTLLCFLWYSSSALTSTSAKQVLDIHPFAITLTLVQFAFIVVSMLALHSLGHLIKIIPINRNSLFYSTPLSILQILGHVLSSAAISYVPVSFHHTIKSMSPIFTVAISILVFKAHFSARTYLALIILTLGVMLTCIGKLDFNTIGFLVSVLATLTFTIQSIISKQILTLIKQNNTLPISAAYTNINLDKMNLMFYSYLIGTLLILPAFLLRDLPFILSLTHTTPFTLHLVSLYLQCSLFHFIQNIVAFLVLSMVSVVTYSIAGLVKRIVVIGWSIFWLGEGVTRMQSVGIVLTLCGVWLYDLGKIEKARGGVLSPHLLKSRLSIDQNKTDLLDPRIQIVI